MDMAGGYRLVRKLGDGGRSSVFLGRGARDTAKGDRVEPVAVKIFRPQTPAGDIDREIDALSRSAHAHSVELLDLAMMADERPCLILRRIGGPSLATVLDSVGRDSVGRDGVGRDGVGLHGAGLGRPPLRLGEVVTAIVPIVRAVEELHRLGVAHGNVRPETILLDDHGAPVLVGFGHARVIGPLPTGSARSLTAAQLEVDPFARADIVALARLTARMIAAAVPLGVHALGHDTIGADTIGAETSGTELMSSPADEPAAELLHWLRQVIAAGPVETARGAATHADSAPGDASELAVLTDRLFQIAPAAEILLPLGTTAIRTAAIGITTASNVAVGDSAVFDSAVGASAVAASAVANSAVGNSAVGQPSEPDERTRVGRLITALDPTFEILEAILGRGIIRRATAALRAALSPVRRTVWIGGAIGVVALVCALVVVPNLGSGSQSGTGEERTPTVAASGASSDDASRGRSDDANRPSSAARSTSSHAVEGRPSGPSAIVGDDPVAATVELTRLRLRCLRGGSTKCLASVDQRGSAAEDADRRLLRDIRAAAEASVDSDGGRKSRTDLLASAPLNATSLAEVTFSLAQSIGDTAILTANHASTANHANTAGDATSAGDATAGGESTAAVEVTTAASVLMIRTEAGWRFRDVLPSG